VQPAPAWALRPRQVRYQAALRPDSIATLILNHFRHGILRRIPHFPCKRQKQKREPVVDNGGRAEQKRCRILNPRTHGQKCEEGSRSQSARNARISMTRSGSGPEMAGAWASSTSSSVIAKSWNLNPNPLARTCEV
jgi:hypothetical protein